MMHLHLTLVRDASTIDTDEPFTRQRIVHHIRVQLLQLVPISTCNTAVTAIACSIVALPLHQVKEEKILVESFAAVQVSFVHGAL